MHTPACHIEQYLSIVTFEVSNILKSVRGKELNESGVSSGKQVTSIAEGTLQSWTEGK